MSMYSPLHQQNTTQMNYTAAMHNCLGDELQSNLSSVLLPKNNIDVEYYKSKIMNLEKQLTNTKIFLNMVIHDMRNPTNSIEFAMKEILKMVEQAVKLGEFPHNLNPQLSGHHDFSYP